MSRPLPPYELGARQSVPPGSDGVFAFFEKIEKPGFPSWVTPWRGGHEQRFISFAVLVE
jgi:hypothetical protein